MTTLRLGYGPLLLLLYQTAPVSVQHDSLGRYRIGVGYSSGQWENEQFSCDGQLLSATPVRHHSFGAQIDAWPSNHVRLTAFGGSASQSVASADIQPFAGPYGGGMLAYEGQKFGIGWGFVHLSNAETQTPPVMYLRFGDIDKAHTRMDIMPPNPALPSVGWARIGLGYNEGHLRKPGGFVGMGFAPFDYNSKVALTGELRYPIARHLMGQIHALVGPGEQNSQWNVGAGLQFDFGRH